MDKYDDLTLGMLRQLLTTLAALPDSTPVGVTDHFGTFEPFPYLPAVNLVKSHREGKPDLTVVHFPSIDIGEEPD